MKKKEVNRMSPAQQAFDYQREMNENQKQIREMVMESCRDIAAGKGRDCNEFFEELARYGIRKVYYKNYKIYFLINESDQTVYILKVFHMLVDSREKLFKIN